MTAQVRCAVYTRKSSEEGLDQAFNSLDAQRQAGLDYIKSQRHEGWTALPDTYDDGGHSGGTIERPALRRLLADIAAGRVDIVVVYKVDRLSRSLADFARLMQLFEDRGVSFVSVTQQFSTTTSMGRLTLNMLLSFAQFEREVAGERIRDKIAATRRRGVWVCGRPPTGYRLPLQGDPDRSLRVHDEEAGLIRRVFERYIELGSPLAVAQELNSTGLATPLWTSARGIRRGGKPFTAKDIHRLLTNPVYIGKIAHTRDGMTELYDALHQPIVEQAVWDKAHAKISKAERDQQRRWTHTHLLKGKLRTAEGHTMSPGSVQRPLRKGDRTGARRIVRYYISQLAIKHGYAACPVKSINAAHLDDLTRAAVIDHLRVEQGIDIRPLPPEERDRCVRDVVRRVTLATDRVVFELDLRSARAPAVPDAGSVTRPAGQSETEAFSVPACLFQPKVDHRDGLTLLSLDIRIKKLDGKRVLLTPEGSDLLLITDPDGAPIPRSNLVQAVALAIGFHRAMLSQGTTLEELAERYGRSKSNIFKLLPLARLGPAVLRAVLTGAIAPSTTLNDLIAAAEHLDWDKQARHLGIGASDSSRTGAGSL